MLSVVMLSVVAPNNAVFAIIYNEKSFARFKSSGHRFCDVVSESTGGTVLGGAGPAVAAGREGAAGAADGADELKMRLFVCYKCLLI